MVICEGIVASFLALESASRLGLLSLRRLCHTKIELSFGKRMYLVRLLVVGDTSVGKTSLLMRFNEGHFILTQKTTIGVDYKAKEIMIDSDSVKLQIWDTAGQERFRSMTSAFYNRAQGVIVTFDVTQYSSFMALETWVNDVNQNAPAGCTIVLCANKTDFPVDKWQVRKEEYMLFAHEHKYTLFEASASSGLNVNEMFTEIGRQVLSKNKSELSLQKQTNERDLVSFDEKISNSNSRKCCIIM